MRTHAPNLPAEAVEAVNNLENRRNKGRDQKMPASAFATQPSERPPTGPPRTAPHFIASAIMRRR